MAALGYSGSPYSLTIDPGKPGREIVAFDTAKLINAQAGKDSVIDAVIASTSTVLNQAEIDQAKRTIAQTSVEIELFLKAENVRLDLNDQELISLLSFPSGFNSETQMEFIQKWQEIVARPAQNAEFEFDPETLHVSPTFFPTAKD